jgi:hypothetical protein
VSEAPKNEEQDDVALPEDAIEDLAPGEDETGDVKGGVYQWWKKVETDGPDG